MVRIAFLIAIFAGLGIGGCATGPTTTGTTTVEQPYVLDAGDQLRVVIYEQPELTNIYRVEQAGHISMPLIGDIPARGLTTPEIEVAIASRLRATYLRNPDVAVEIAVRRPFFILGEVNNAGQYPHVPGVTVRSAVAVAGGFSPRANERVFKLTRAINGEALKTRIGLDEPVLPGDTIQVSERLF
ncbi:MAG: polysaccharide biosynthesis/export family protein [Alphaproteobacteria bacterium]